MKIKKLSDNLKDEDIYDKNINYYKFYEDSLSEFKILFLNNLKKELIGKIVYIYGNKRKIGKNTELEKICDALKISIIYKIKVEDIEYNGTYINQVRCVNIIDNNKKSYFLRKIVDEETYNKFIEKINNYNKNKEKLKNIDPLGEEIW